MHANNEWKTTCNLEEKLFIKNLRRLIRFSAPSWREDKIAKEFARLLGLEWETDWLGNVIARLNGNDSINICLAAHMDQVFFRVRKDMLLESWRGLWHFPNGKWYQKELEEFIKSGKEYVKTLESNKVLRVKGYELTKGSIRVEIDANRIHLRELQPGELAINLPSLKVTRNRLLIGSPLDDRVGLALLISIANYFKSKPLRRRPNLIFIGTVAEETGNSYEIEKLKNLKNKISILIDAYCPLLKGIELGKGPVIEYYEKTWSKKSFEIICQMQDSYPMQIREHKDDYITNLKYPFGNEKLVVISFPVSRIHTSAEIVSIKDIEYLFEVIIQLVKQLVEH